MRALACGVLAALVMSLLAPAVAGAHATVVRTTPADRSVVGASPRQVTIRWSEPVDLGPGSVRLLSATGGEIDTPEAKHIGSDRSAAVFTVPPGLKDGTYVVAWRVTSADSHPVSGAFSFSVGQPSSLVTAGAPGSSSAVVKAVDGVARGVSFVGFALAVGGACVLLLLWPEGPSSARGRRFLQAGLGALLAGTVALLLLQGPYTTGGSLLDALEPSLLSFSLSTRFGQALLVRIVLTLAFAAVVARALRAAESRAVAPAAAAGGEVAPSGGGVARARGGLVWAGTACVLGLLLTWTLTDHSRTGVQVWLGIPAASAHLLAMALWLGGLALLLACVLGRGSRESLEPVVPRFSQMALLCFGVLGVTGVYLSWRQAGELAALPATEFGRLLLIKSAIVLAIIGLAALSRRAVHTSRPPADLARRLRRTVVVEAVLGVVVLGMTATLVNAAPARVKYAPPYSITVAGAEGGKVQVHVVPAKQGQNVTDIYLVQRDGRLLVPPQLTARLKPPSGTKDLGPLPVDLTAAEPGHYVATAMSVPFPGHWTLELSVRTSDIDENAIDVPVRDPMRLALALVFLAFFPASALAHVTVLPESSRPGQTGVFTFRTPNEREDAATVRLDVFMPAGVGIETQPHDGWTATRISGGVSWTADGDNSIRPGRTEDFKVRLGPLPDQPRIVFKALQYYADGQIVRWIQDPTADAERPAAVLDLGGQVAIDGVNRPQDSGSGTAAIVGLLVFVAVILALMLVVWRRRRV